MTMKTTGRVLVTGLLCAVLAACGTRTSGQAAGPAPVPGMTPGKCALDVPTEEQTGGYAGPPTDQETGGYAGPPTDQETGGYAGPPTDQETGGYAGPPTDQETGGYAGPPTDQETGGYAGPPTDQDTGDYVGPPTDGEMTNGGGPCGPADWFDMTRDFKAYYVQHQTKADDMRMDSHVVVEARVRKMRKVGEAKITFRTDQVGKGQAEVARRVAEMFAAWRHDVYGDTGTVIMRTSDGAVVVTEEW
uniref:Lipoprotein n=1 Tax=Streptomyces sp. NBC_00049 TaxID=2903617 RepID=A0AAU2K2V2_9ACTN